jgi:hypothetical protein
MKKVELLELRQLTILAAIARPENDFRVEMGRDVAHGVIRSARSRNNVRNSASFSRVRVKLLDETLAPRSFGQLSVFRFGWLSPQGKGKREAKRVLYVARPL